MQPQVSLVSAGLDPFISHSPQFRISLAVALWWADLGWMPGIHQASLSLLLSRSKGKQNLHPLFPISRQCTTPFQEAISVFIVVSLENVKTNAPHLLLSPSFYCTLSFWVSSPGFVSPQILPTPSLLVRGNSWRDSPDAVPALLSRGQNTVC